MKRYIEVSPHQVAVIYEGKRIGSIYQTPRSTWQYWENAKMFHGAEYPTLEECKKSLEAS